MDQNDVAEVKRLVTAADDRRYAAMLAGDIDSLNELLSADLIYVHTTGDTDDRDSYIRAVRTGVVEYKHLERDEHGYTARPGVMVATGRQVGVSILNGEARLIDCAYLSVWFLEEKEWRLAAWHATPFSRSPTGTTVEPLISRAIQKIRDV